MVIPEFDEVAGLELLLGADELGFCEELLDAGGVTCEELLGFCEELFVAGGVT